MSLNPRACSKANDHRWRITLVEFFDTATSRMQSRGVGAGSVEKEITQREGELTAVRPLAAACGPVVLLSIGFILDPCGIGDTFLVTPPGIFSLLTSSPVTFPSTSWLIIANRTGTADMAHFDIPTSAAPLLPKRSRKRR